jgi:Cd2+/Zn2+-exporting ATPase
MEREHKIMLVRILGAVVLMAAAWALPLTGFPKFLVFLIPYAIAGWDILWRAAKNIVHGEVFDENFLMSVATVGALALGEYPEAVAVMVFYQIGELAQDIAVDHSRASIEALMDIRPDSANLEKGGEVVSVRPEEVPVGAVILVKPGERIPLDGEVLSGVTSLNTSALTGESLPRDARPGDEVLSGCVNLTGAVRVKVTKPFGESTVSKILALIQNSSDKKAKTEQFITRFARVYTPLVVLAALALALVPPLFTGYNFGDWIKSALVFLVISCPCALVLSVPLAFFGGIGGASREGILIKGGNFVEALARAETVVFDKTGTLTRGVFEVAAVHPDQLSGEKLLELAALAEQFSDHPIAASLKAAARHPYDRFRVTAAREVAGQGVCATIDGREVCVGNGRLMDSVGAPWRDCHLHGTIAHVAVDGVYEGHIVISDKLKDGAEEAVKVLRDLGVKRVVMLTGDQQAPADHAKQELGIDEAYGNLLPADKVAKVEALIGRKSKKGTLLFVGDGINDAPVLSRADVGLAMGAMGSDAAIEAADVVLMDDKLEKLPRAIKIARRTIAIARQNIVFALSVKGVVLLLGALRIANLWLALAADVGVAIIAILNSARALKVKQ